MSHAALPSLAAALLPHRVERDFLPSEVADALLDWAIAAQARFVPARVVIAPGESGVNAAQRSSLKLPDLGPFKDIFRDRILGAAPEQIAGYIGAPFTAELVEVEMAAHVDGGFFGRHIDTVRGQDSYVGQREVSGVYYFHRRPRGFDGGLLRLYEIEMPPRPERHVDVAPAHNSIVFFPSFLSHEVLPVRVPSQHFADNRFSINFWFNRAVC